MLDLGMPHLDGVQVIAALRGWTSVPILVVSGRTGVGRQSRGPRRGGRRLRHQTLPDGRAARATPRPHPPSCTGGAGDAAGGTIRRCHGRPRVPNGDPRGHARAAHAHGMAHPGVPGPSTRACWCHRQTLLTEIWGSEHVTDTGYLRLYIAQLRKKLEADPGAPACTSSPSPEWATDSCSTRRRAPLPSSFGR